MRFYLGFSKRINIKTIIQFLGFLFVALCAFFGISQITVLAWTNSSPNGYDVHAYRPLYGSGSGDNNGTCTPTTPEGCTNQNQLYNATGCNNKTYSNKTYCFFQNNNSTTYFSTAPMACNSSGQCAIAYGETYGTNTTYRPQSMLVWRWKNNNVSYCTSGNVKLRFEFYSLSDNSVLTATNRCAFNLNSVTSSIGICSPLVKVNNGYYVGSSISSGTNTIMYETTIPKPTTDLEIIIDDIQPFLVENVGEGATYSTKYWNYGFRLDSYECTETSSNTDSNSIINSITSSSQNIINNNNNNTNNINQHIDNSATAIVDSIDDLKDHHDENTQQIIDSQKVCDNKEYYINSTNKDDFSIGYLSSEGAVINSDNFRISDYININDSVNISITTSRYGNWNLYYCLYDISKSLKSCSLMPTNNTITFNTDSYYLRFSAYVGSNANVNTIVTICKNGNQSIYDYISDSTVPDDIELDTDLVDSIEDNNTLQQLAMYPINLLNMIVDSRDPSGVIDENSCQTLSLDLSPITRKWGNFDYTLTIPCLGLKAKELIGDTWFNIFDVLLASLLFYFYVCHLVEFIDLFTDGVDMFPGFFTNHIKQQYVNDRTGEVSYK